MEEALRDYARELASGPTSSLEARDRARWSANSKPRVGAYPAAPSGRRARPLLPAAAIATLTVAPGDQGPTR